MAATGFKRRLIYGISCFSVAALVSSLAVPNVRAAGKTGLKKKAGPASTSGTVNGEEIKSPITFKSIIGNWSLKYSGNYGYYFSLSSSYRALIIIYASTQSFVFRGVYTIEEKGRLKVSISEMKNEPSVTGINLYRGFVKAKSSYFLFNGYRATKNREEHLYLRPAAVIIDGNPSEGFFEPQMKLTKN